MHAKTPRTDDPLGIARFHRALRLAFFAVVCVTLGAGCVTKADPDDTSADTRGNEPVDSSSSTETSTTSPEEDSGGTMTDGTTDSDPTADAGETCVEAGGMSGNCCSGFAVQGVCCLRFGDACEIGQPCCSGECDGATGMCPEAPTCGAKLGEPCREQECCDPLACSDADVCALTCAEPGDPCDDEQCCEGLTCDGTSSTCIETTACASEGDYCGEQVSCCDDSYCYEELARCEQQPA